MSRISAHHQELDRFGQGKCSVPMWDAYGPAGFCDEPAYGERPAGLVNTRPDGFQWRDDGLYTGYVPALACPVHGGPKVRTFMDGNAWCAVRPDFTNLQESHAGFGSAREEAVAKLTSTELRGQS